MINKIINYKPTTTYIFYSSHLFLIPTIFAFYHSQYLFSVTSGITYVVSAAYWYNPIHGFRRDLDLIFAKISFSTYAIYNVLHLFNSSESNSINDIFSLLIREYSVELRNLYFIILFYNLSNGFSMMEWYIWIYFHVLFHIVITHQQCYVCMRYIK